MCSSDLGRHADGREGGGAPPTPPHPLEGGRRAEGWLREGSPPRPRWTCEPLPQGEPWAPPCPARGSGAAAGSLLPPKRWRCLRLRWRWQPRSPSTGWRRSVRGAAPSTAPVTRAERPAGPPPRTLSGTSRCSRAHRRSACRGADRRGSLRFLRPRRKTLPSRRHAGRSPSGARGRRRPLWPWPLGGEGRAAGGGWQRSPARQGWGVNVWGERHPLWSEEGEAESACARHSRGLLGLASGLASGAAAGAALAAPLSLARLWARADSKPLSEPSWAELKGDFFSCREGGDRSTERRRRSGGGGGSPKAGRRRKRSPGGLPPHNT